MRLMITGHTGFIARDHLVPRLSQEHEVVLLASDLMQFDAVREEVVHHQPDQIIHLAARTEVERSFYEQTTFSQINYVGTVNLVEAAAQVPHLKNFVFASTMEVFGWQPISDLVKQGRPIPRSEAFNERTAPHPNAPYAVAKLACEKYLEYAHRALGLPFTALRLTNCYGRTDNTFFVTEQIISQMLQGNECRLGYDRPYRNFIWIDDMVDMWATVIANPHRCNQGNIFTIGPDHPIQIRAYAEMIARKLSWQGEIHWNTKPQRPGEIYWLNSDSRLIHKTLGWQPTTALDRGLDLAIERLTACR